MYLVAALHGHGESAALRRERRAHRVQPAHELAVGTRAPRAPRCPTRAMRCMFATTYGGVGELDADLGDRRADRAHAVGNHVHRAPLHRAGEQPVSVAFISAGSRQLLVGPASSCASSR